MVLQFFLRHYGREIGDYMLKINPQGGLFLMGGVSLALWDYLGKPESGFLDAVYNKGRVSGMIREIPIYSD